MYIDSHAHLYMLVKEKNIDINSIFKDMLENEVSCVTNISGNQAESKFHTEHIVPAAEKNGISLYHSAGIHPHVSSGFSNKDIDWLNEISPFIDAVGEVGMDLHYNFSPEKSQESVLLKMIDISIELKKPLIVHG
ncbi:MAG TPA: hypothetical protein ENN58_03660, partial [bacterium]|nr:hypothetical protein [bacterium]